MTKSFTLSKNEEQIMQTMWREQRPLTRSEVIDLTENKTWKESSIHILLNQLLKKGAIEVEGEVLKGINYARLYVPTLSEDEYDVMQLKKTIREINPKQSTITNFFAALVDSNDIKEDTIKDLEEILKQRKNK